MNVAERLACRHIAQLEPYMSARRIGGSGSVWINANELPFQESEYLIDSRSYHRYPDHSPDQLMQAYADYCGLGREQVLATRGADEAIDLLVQAFCYSGKDSLSHCPPTYGLYDCSGKLHDVAVHSAPLKNDFSLDVEAICQAPSNTKLVFLCNPNNPSGNAISRDDLLAVVKHFNDKALVVVDEAYIEFTPKQSLINELSQFEHLVVLRTLSKAFGLAGVHVGFALANPTVISVLNRAISPYAIAEPCAQIAIQALSQFGIDRMNKNALRVLDIRNDFSQKLKGIGGVVEVFPSVTNFVLASFDDVENAWGKLITAGVVARQQTHPSLKNCIRFSMGNEQEMDLTLQALE